LSARPCSGKKAVPPAATLTRVALLIPPERTVTIVNQDHLPIATAQLGVLPDREPDRGPRGRP